MIRRGLLCIMKLGAWDNAINEAQNDEDGKDPYGFKEKKFTIYIGLVPVSSFRKM